MKLQKIQVELVGLRPMLFNRYPGDNNTKLPAMEKMYLTKDMGLIIPSVNLYSLLCAENGKSVCKMFFGKQGKNIGLGIASYTAIEEFDIPLLGVDKKQIVFSGWNSQIYPVNHVARLKNGVPCPVERPRVDLPWSLVFNMQYQENKLCTLENLRQALTMGGILGLGSFRPYYGRYEMTRFDLV